MQDVLWEAREGCTWVGRGMLHAGEKVGVTYQNIFPAGFPTDFTYGKPARKVANGNQVTMGML